jgi:hypothetical protein
MGGARPTKTHRSASAYLCEECRQVAERLINEGRIVFRCQERDTTNSRYSKLKAAIKRARFGHANMSIQEVKTKLMQQPGNGTGKPADLELNDWL